MGWDGGRSGSQEVLGQMLVQPPWGEMMAAWINGEVEERGVEKHLWVSEAPLGLSVSSAWMEGHSGELEKPVGGGGRGGQESSQGHANSVMFSDF